MRCAESPQDTSPLTPEGTGLTFVRGFRAGGSSVNAQDSLSGTLRQGETEVSFSLDAPLLLPALFRADWTSNTFDLPFFEAQVRWKETGLRCA